MAEKFDREKLNFIRHLIHEFFYQETKEKTPPRTPNLKEIQDCLDSGQPPVGSNLFERGIVYSIIYASDMTYRKLRGDKPWPEELSAKKQLEEAVKKQKKINPFTSTET